MVQLIAFPESGDRRWVDLVGVVPADAAAVVADAVRVGLARREQEHAVVLERERRDDYEVGGLEVHVALSVDIRHSTCEAVLAGLDPEHLRLRPHLVVAGVDAIGRCVLRGLALASTSQPKRVQKPQ